MAKSSTKPWQVAWLEAIIDLDVIGFSMLADAIGDPSKRLQLRLERMTVSRDVVFSFDGELFPPAGGMQHLGFGYRFEHEGERAAIGAWLDMVGAKSGDTLLHLALRLSGADDDDEKVCLVVEMLGRGASFEVENLDHEIPSMIDPACFKQASSVPFAPAHLPTALALPMVWKCHSFAGSLPAASRMAVAAATAVRKGARG